MRHPEFPEPIGVFRAIEKPTYAEGILGQITEAIEIKGKGDLDKLYRAADTWEVKEEAAPTNGHQSSMGDQAIVGSETDEEYTGVIFHGEQSSDPYADQNDMMTDTLADLNPRKPLIAPVDTPLTEALDQMNQLNVGLMTLVDDEGKLVGVFTEGDVFMKVAGRIENLDDKKVSDYMTPRVSTLKPDTTIAYALHFMALHRFPSCTDCG